MEASFGQSKLFFASIQKHFFFGNINSLQFFMEQTIEMFFLLMMYLSPFFSIVVHDTKKRLFLKHLLSPYSFFFLGRFSAKNSFSFTTIGK